MLRLIYSYNYSLMPNIISQPHAQHPQPLQIPLLAVSECIGRLASSYYNKGQSLKYIYVPEFRRRLADHH